MTLSIIHCVDAEGPLEETLEATFQRLRKEKNIDFTPSLATLVALQNQSIDLDGKEKEVAEYLSPARLAYLSTWQHIEEMIIEATDYNFRQKYTSPDGSLYTYSWFVIDVVGYKDNPRRKATGFHTVWDQYHRMLNGRMYNDVMGWHFHTVPPNLHALHYNSSWTNNDFHEQVLARRIIEKKWFPALFRSGGVIQRNDLSHWMERFIPFDYSNQNNKYAKYQPGDQSDWRNAQMEWGYYHPDFYDYRKKGSMKRAIFRCLDIFSPGCQLDEDEIEEAFRLSLEKEVVLAYTNHDRRDIRPEIDKIHKMITQISKKYPSVKWKYDNALTAAQKSLGFQPKSDLQLKLTLENHLLWIESNQILFSGDIFLAIEEQGEMFYRDNVTIESETSWAYCSPRWESINRIGVAAVTADGQVVCEVIRK